MDLITPFFLTQKVGQFFHIQNKRHNFLILK
jgi:hypothetical protein